MTSPEQQDQNGQRQSTSNFNVLVCGGRDFDDWEMLDQGLTSVYMRDNIGTKMRIIEGEAIGADFLARVWAKYRHLPFKGYKAEWKKYGKAAGPKRNQQMLDEEDIHLAIAFPGGTGTADMVKRAKKSGVEVIEVN